MRAKDRGLTPLQIKERDTKEVLRLKKRLDLLRHEMVKNVGLWSYSQMAEALKLANNINKKLNDIRLWRAQ